MHAINPTWSAKLNSKKVGHEEEAMAYFLHRLEEEP